MFIKPLRDYEKAVKRCLAWKGADKLLVPLLPGLLDIQEYEILDTIVTSTTVPATVVKSLGQLLLTRDDEKSMQLLSSIYQRHLDLLQLSNDDVEGTDSRLVLEVEKKLTNLTAVSLHDMPLQIIYTLLTLPYRRLRLPRTMPRASLLIQITSMLQFESLQYARCRSFSKTWRNL